MNGRVVVIIASMWFFDFVYFVIDVGFKVFFECERDVAYELFYGEDLVIFYFFLVIYV